MVTLYGGLHQRTRRALKPTVDSGNAYCAEIICLHPSRWINPATPWHLAHDRTTGGYLGPAHARCNMAEQARNRHQVRHGHTTHDTHRTQRRHRGRHTASRDW